MKIKFGDTVTYTSYGQEKSSVVRATSRDGKIVFLTNSRWLWKESVCSINGRPVTKEPS